MVTFLNQARIIVEQRIFNRPDKVYYHLKNKNKKQQKLKYSSLKHIQKNFVRLLRQI